MIYQKNFQQGDFQEESNLSCQSYDSKLDMPCPLHCHSYYEISYIFDGERNEEWNGSWHEIGKQSLFFIPPLYVHGYTNITHVDDLVIQFTSDFLKQLSPSLFAGHMLSLKSKQPFIQLELPYLNDLRNLSLRKNELRAKEKSPQINQELFLNELQMHSLVLTLLQDLINADYLCLLERNITDHDSRLFDSIINEILLHPDQVPDMETAADSVGMSYYAFSRRFLAATGFHYSEYCNLLKIQHAERLLLNTNMSVSEVGEAIGIMTFSYFSRLFKNICGMSPSEYRKTYRNVPHFQ